MLETTFLKKLLVLGLAFTIGGLVAAGCIDNSGNKTYPRADSGTADAGQDVAVSDDAGTGDVAAATDAPGSDAPAVDVKVDVSLPVDVGVDIRLDSGSGG